MTYEPTELALDEESKAVFNQAHTLLKATYQQHWSTAQSQLLAQVLHDYGPDAEHILAAVQSHIADTTESASGTRIGALPPKPADILAHIETLEQRQAREVRRDEDESRAEQVRQWEQQDAADQYHAIDLKTLPEVAAGFWRTYAAQGRRKDANLFIHLDGDCLMIPQQKGWYKRCGACADTGFAFFYYDPKDRGRVWVREEYVRLPKAMQDTLKRHQAVCDKCLLGEETKVRFKAAILGTGDHGKVLTLMSKIRKLAGWRRQNEGAEQEKAA